MAVLRTGYYGTSRVDGRDEIPGGMDFNRVLSERTMPHGYIPRAFTFLESFPAWPFTKCTNVLARLVNGPADPRFWLKMASARIVLVIYCFFIMFML
jgi:hypothetical protein